MKSQRLYIKAGAVKMEEDRNITDDLSDIPTTELIKSLPNYFIFNGNPYRTAYLNWRFDFIKDTENQFFDMAEGYFEAAIALLDNCIADNNSHKADVWIFPIMFSTVHGIEVYLKGINLTYSILERLELDEYQESKIEGNHDIKQLCQNAIKHMRDTKNKELLDEMLFVQQFIAFLYENTHNMDFTRYPVSPNGKKQFYVEKSENVTIDLDVFRQWILRVFSILDSCSGYLSFEVGETKQWRADMLNEYGGY